MTSDLMFQWQFYIDRNDLIHVWIILFILFISNLIYFRTVMKFRVINRDFNEYSSTRLWYNQILSTRVLEYDSTESRVPKLFSSNRYPVSRLLPLQRNNICYWLREKKLNLFPMFALEYRQAINKSDFSRHTLLANRVLVIPQPLYGNKGVNRLITEKVDKIIFLNNE